MVFQSHVRRPLSIDCAPPFSEKTETIEVNDTVNIDGRVLNRSILKEVAIADKFKGLSVFDFTMENLVAAGAVDNLHEIQLIGNDGKSVDAVISRADALATRLSAVTQNISEND